MLKSEMKRLFLAIDIVPDEHFLAVYLKLKQQLKDEKIRWVEPANLHITLKFFGETPIEKIDSIKNLMYKITDQHTPFTLNIRRTGIFGSRYKPRVIWFGIDKNEQLISLVSHLLNELEIIGFAGDRQNFVPHLSLGRLKSVQHKVNFQKAIDRVKDVFVQDIQVRKITLFESLLQPTGVVYKTIEEFELNSSLD